uniref:Helix-turn-helix domain-containing protein n=1 Tax=Phenylobacterium glaciei TaxID=2803784 RepID=A0A974P5A2_9CAUL|nr:helix-turn-helix domain-containing protein [Phenylobacterium glaciei]
MTSPTWTPGWRPSAAAPPRTPARASPKWRPLAQPRKAKIHRSYSVAEVAALFGVTRGAVRTWCKADLPAVKIAGDLLIYGEELRAFLEKRRAARRAVCPPGSIYCMKCRVPRRPALEEITVTPLMGTAGNIRAPCPHCGASMNRRVSLPDWRNPGLPVSA